MSREYKEMVEANQAKLAKRYSKGTYSDADAIERKDKQRPNEDSIL